MILRPARADDSAAFESFDLGDVSEPFLAEVAEIVGGLWGWVSDPTASEQDRVVLVAEEDGELVGVVAHHLLVDARGGAIDGHRYLMVTAIQRRCRRGGYATAIAEAVLDELRDSGVRTVDWLVHPRNLASIAFSSRTFPTADETRLIRDLGPNFATKSRTVLGLAGVMRARVAGRSRAARATHRS